MSRPAVLFDRDGTLTAHVDGYVTDPDDLVLIEGAKEALARLSRAGWPLAVVTNQSGVGRGLMSAQDLDAVNARFERQFAEGGVSFDGVYACPHPPDQGCDCRKPLPGLLVRAAKEHSYDLMRSYMIGDSSRDLLAGRAAGATSLLVLTGHEVTAPHPADRTFPSVVEAVNWILERER